MGPRESPNSLWEACTEKNELGLFIVTAVIVIGMRVKISVYTEKYMQLLSKNPQFFWCYYELSEFFSFRVMSFIRGAVMGWARTGGKGEHNGLLLNGPPEQPNLASPHVRVNLRFSIDFVNFELKVELCVLLVLVLPNWLRN